MADGSIALRDSKNPDAGGSRWFARMATLAWMRSR